MDLLGFLDRYSNLLLVVITAVYASLTYFLVRETRHHRFQQVLPYPRILFQKAPDNVLLENIGPGIVAKAVLQGFTWKEGAEIWQCTFEPVYTILPRETMPMRFSIDIKVPEMEGRPLLDDRAIFQIAFQQALRVLDDVPLVLNLYSEDIFGNCYRSLVRVDSQDWYMSWKHEQRQRWAAVTLPPIRDRRKFGESLPVVDTTK